MHVTQKETSKQSTWGFLFNHLVKQISLAVSIWFVATTDDHLFRCYWKLKGIHAVSYS